MLHHTDQGALVNDDTLAHLMQQRDELLKKLERVNSAIDARFAELLGAHQPRPRESLTEAEFRAFASNAPAGTVGRAWLLLLGSIANRLKEIDPNLDIRHGGSGDLNRTRLIAAEPHITTGMVRGYGQSHHRLVLDCIAHLKQSGASAPEATTGERH